VFRSLMLEGSSFPRLDCSSPEESFGCFLPCLGPPWIYCLSLAQQTQRQCCRLPIMLYISSLLSEDSTHESFSLMV
jgi:hypothetical protein